MANPHHRAKHKSYVTHKHQAQQHQHHENPAKANKKAALPLAIVGAVAGLFLAYVINKESVVTSLAGLAIGFVAGFLFGNSIDKSISKKK